MKEQVLCFPAELLNEVNFTNKVVTKPQLVEDCLKKIFAGPLSFIDRAQAEQDPSWKQIIPYCVLRDKGRVFAYQRTKKGGEARLHDLYSIGVGGHVNPIDGSDGRQAYEAGLYRELHEEVGLEVDDGKLFCTPFALIYDDSNEVGRVHFGIANVVSWLGKIKFSPNKDSALSKGAFYNLEDLRAKSEKMENWSKILLTVL